MSIPKNILEENPGLGEWSILTAYRGSISHNMYVPQENPDSIDDKDVMAICIPPIDYYLGLKQFHSRGTQEIKKGEWDIVVYEIKKVISMLEKGNPNVLSLLWTDEQFVINETDEGIFLRENRQLFVGRHVYHSFTGYAYSQLYKLEHLACEGYMGKKRKQLVEKFGYDTKNAAHLLRLLRMGIEFLNEGELYVKRSDNQELLAIKRGEWSLDRVKSEATLLFKRSEEAYDRSKLQNKPDHEKINTLCVNLIEMRLR